MMVTINKRIPREPLRNAFFGGSTLGAVRAGGWRVALLLTVVSHSNEQITNQPTNHQPIVSTIGDRRPRSTIISTLHLACKASLGLGHLKQTCRAETCYKLLSTDVLRLSIGTIPPLAPPSYLGWAAPIEKPNISFVLFMWCCLCFIVRQLQMSSSLATHL